MRKYLLLLMMALLVACGAAEPPANDSAPAGGQATDDNGDGATNDSAQNTQPADAGAASDLEPIPAIEPSTFPVEAAEIRSRDWVKGAAEPVVSIIEFGDFQ